MEVCAKSADVRSRSSLKEFFGHMDQLKVAKVVAACLAKPDSASMLANLLGVLSVCNHV